MSLDNILLGLLRKPASGYDIKTAFNGSTRYFWAAELSQIYTALQRLEREGCLRSRMVSSNKGPDRRVYSITSRGRKRFESWLLDHPQFGQERFAYIAQLYFMDALCNPTRSLEFIRELKQLFVERLRSYRQIEIEANWASGANDTNLSDADFHRYMTLRAGILTTEARIRWCDETIERIHARMPCTPKKASRTRKGRRI